MKVENVNLVLDRLLDVKPLTTKHPVVLKCILTRPLDAESQIRDQLFFKRLKNTRCPFTHAFSV